MRFCMVGMSVFHLRLQACFGKPAPFAHNCKILPFSILAQIKSLSTALPCSLVFSHRLLLITMPPTPHQTVMDRFHASRSRADDLLLKLRVKRVVDTLKTNKGELYRVENELVEKGMLEQLPMHSTKPAAPP